MLGCVGFLVAVQLGIAVEANAFGRDDDQATVVQDLAYGEVLFYFFQEDYFSALTHLLAALESFDVLISPHRDAASG